MTQTPRTGPFGPVIPSTPVTPVVLEKWVPCNTPGYLKNTKTGEIKRKED